MKRIGVVAILVLAFCGLADAAYLTEHVVSGSSVICNIQGLSDCNTIIVSQYSRFLGIPLAELGVFFYGILFVLAALELFIFDRFLRRVLQVAAVVGVAASLYFVLLQAFVIHAFCAYCLVSALIAVLVFVVATFIEPFTQKKTEVSQPSLPTSPPVSRLQMPPTP